MPESFSSYLFSKRHKLALLGKKKLTQEEMAEHLSRQLSEKLGREVPVSRRAYNKWENGTTTSPLEAEIREILGK